MKNSTRFLIGWLLAAAIAVGFSLGAIAQVRNRVIPPSVVIPTTELTEALAAAEPTASTATSAPRVVRVEPEALDGAIPTSEVPTATSTSSPQPPPQITSPATTEPPPPTTTAPPGTTTTSVAPVTTTTTLPPITETSSYSLVGGVVTISHSPGIVNFVSAIPQPGYSTDRRETGPDEVRIRFEGDDHTSEFRARWQGGELEITKNENGE